MIGRAIVAREGSCLRPGEERGGIEGRKGEKEVREIAFHVDHENGDLGAEGLFDRERHETRFPAPGHANDDAMGDEVVGRQTERIAMGVPSRRRALPRCRFGRGEPPLAPKGLGFEKPLCASLDGFTLHAATRAGALDAAGREALLRYVLRPPLAQDRIERRPDGLVRISLKRAYTDGTVAVDMSSERGAWYQ
jgi:hypothetical protein